MDVLIVKTSVYKQDISLVMYELSIISKYLLIKFIRNKI